MSKQFRTYNVNIFGIRKNISFYMGDIQASSPDKAAEFALDDLSKVLPSGNYEAKVKCRNRATFIYRVNVT